MGLTFLPNPGQVLRVLRASCPSFQTSSQVPGPTVTSLSVVEMHHFHRVPAFYPQPICAKTANKGLERVQQFQALAVPTKDLSSVLSICSHRYVAQNPVIPGWDALFRSPQAQGTHVVHIYTCRQNTCKDKINFKKNTTNKLGLGHFIL